MKNLGMRARAAASGTALQRVVAGWSLAATGAEPAISGAEPSRSIDAGGIDGRRGNARRACERPCDAHGQVNGASRSKRVPWRIPILSQRSRKPFLWMILLSAPGVRTGRSQRNAKSL